MERNKILHIHEVYKPYGGGSAIRISRLLENSNHTIPTVLCSYKGADNAPHKERIDGVNIIRIGHFKSPLLLFTVVRLLLKNRYNFIHVHNSWVQLLILPLAMYSSVVLELNSMKARKGLKRVLHTMAIKSANRYIVLSQSAKEYLENIYSVDESKVDVVLNGFVARELRNKSQNLELRESIRLFYAGSLYEWQGIQNVLLCAKFFEDKENYEFHIVGDGPMLTFIMEYIEMNKLQNVYIQNTLQQDAYLKFISEMDIALFLRPKKLETETTFPLKIPEYIYWNIPILLTDRRAHFELSDYNVRHELYNIVRDEHVCQDVQKFIKNYSQLTTKAKMLKASIDWSKYTWNMAAEKYEDLYDRG